MSYSSKICMWLLNLYVFFTFCFTYCFTITIIFRFNWNLNIIYISNKKRSAFIMIIPNKVVIFALFFVVCYPVTSLMHAKVDRNSGKPTFDRAFCIRMKSTLTKRGCHFKSSGYRVNYRVLIFAFPFAYNSHCCRKSVQAI